MKQFKRGLAFLLAIVLVMSCLSVGAQAATTKKKATVKSVTITNPSTKTLVMKKGKTFQVKTKVTTTGKKVSKALTFASSNKKVATVSGKGKIKALANGKATITVTSKANKKKKATLKVVVKTPVTKVTLDKKELTLTEGEKAAVKATVSPKKATITKVAYTTSDKTVATVDSKGNITAVKEGKATITATAQDGNNKKATCKVTVVKKEVPAEKPAETPNPTPEPDKPSTPTPIPSEKPEEVKLDRTGYKEVWKDEFNSVSLNSADWNVELHEPGWVNEEWQEYVDSDENIYIEDGSLILKPVRKQAVSENGTPIEGKYTYTSGRVNTQGKHDFTYGLFETRAKVPTGKGYLPAFWMMPTDENLYGQWPRCGEIDIMEVMGDEIDKLYGTIHYGNPHGQSQGTKKLAKGDFSNEYHDFAVEWEPGKIVWYVDGVKFHEENDWYSTTEGQGTVSYPAPFDQPFYMILNLAIGGSWVGYPDATTTYEDQEFAIDYVKVSRKDQSYYDALEAKAERPAKDPVVEPADGVYIQNGNFAEADDLSGKSNWQFMTAKGGEATASIVPDEKFGTGAKAVKISTTKAGTEDYAVQFIQANIPLKQGNTYKVSFDAYAASERTMIVDVSAPDLNYARYLNDTVVNLTTEKKTYEYSFDMTGDDDANGRLEFNLGNTDKTADVFLSNVKVEKVGTFEVDNSKKVQADGNYISNGKFQQTTDTAKKNLADWTVEDKTQKAVYGVTGVEDGRKFNITTTGCEAADDVVLKQVELPITAGKYELTFDAAAVGGATITVNVAGQEKAFDLTEDVQKYSWKLTVAEDATIEEIDDIVFALGVNAKVILDNISLVEDTLIKNGSFNADLAGWEPYADTPSNVSYTVDTQKEDGAFDITIQDTGKLDWYIQLKQNNVALKKDQWYKLSFDIKSSLDRKVSYAIQRDGSKHNDDWTPYVQEVIDISSEYQRVEKVFKMKLDTDLESVFNITMGAVGGTQISEQHRICIDNVVLETTEAQEDPVVPKEIGVNLLTLEADAWNTENKLEDTTVDGDGASYTYTINSLGANSYSVELKQEKLQFEEDCKYEVAFDVTSSVDRSLKTIVQENGGSWETYSADSFKVKAGEKLAYKHYFTMEKSTDIVALFAIDMGKVKEVSYGEHTINIESISVKKITDEEYEAGLLVEQARKDAEKAEEETEQGEIFIGKAAEGTKNLLKNADFSAVTEDGKFEDWSFYGGVMSEDKKGIVVNTTNSNIYDAQLSQKIALEAGKTYEIKAVVKSTNDRKIQIGAQNASYEPYGTNAQIELEAGISKVYTEEITMPVSDDNVTFFSNLNGAANQEEGTVVFEEIYIKEVTQNLLANADFSAVTEDGKFEDWSFYGGVMSEDKKGIVVNTTNSNIYDAQLSQIIALETGKTYEIKAVVKSTNDRKIQIGAQNASYEPYGTNAQIELKAGISKVYTEEITMSVSDDNVTFFTNLNGANNQEEGTVVFEALYVKEVIK